MDKTRKAGISLLLSFIVLVVAGFCAFFGFLNLFNINPEMLNDDWSNSVIAIFSFIFTYSPVLYVALFFSAVAILFATFAGASKSLALDIASVFVYVISTMIILASLVIIIALYMEPPILDEMYKMGRTIQILQ